MCYNYLPWTLEYYHIRIVCRSYTNGSTILSMSIIHACIKAYYKGQDHVTTEVLLPADLVVTGKLKRIFYLHE